MADKSFVDTNMFLLEQKLQQRNEMIAHLKDQLQEMKAKTSMEGKYIKKDAEVKLRMLHLCKKLHGHRNTAML